MKAVGNALFEEVFQNIRKAAEANLSMQQELFSQWATLWPGIPAPHSAWVGQLQTFRTKFTDAVSAMARRHRDVIDRQYNAAMESLDAALCVTDANTPEEFRRRSEQLCRKSIDCIRTVAESQVEEMQDALTKLTTLFTTSAT
jgi:hypothetical protein